MLGVGPPWVESRPWETRAGASGLVRSLGNPAQASFNIPCVIDSENNRCSFAWHFTYRFQLCLHLGCPGTRKTPSLPSPAPFSSPHPASLSHQPGLDLPCGGGTAFQSLVAWSRFVRGTGRWPGPCGPGWASGLGIPYLLAFCQHSPHPPAPSVPA